MRPTFFAVMFCALALPASAQQQAQQPQRTQTQSTTQSTTRATAPAAPTGAPPQPPAPPAPESNGSRYLPVNVKVDVTITDQQNGQTPIKRSTSVIASDGNRGSVRSSANIVGSNSNIPLDIDASPVILRDGHIKLQFSLSYDLPGIATESPKPGQLTRRQLSNSLTLVLTDGKPLQVSQSADAIGDRNVSVEITATILK